MSFSQNTSFPANTVPLASEEASSWLKTAYQADESTIKVDLSLRVYADKEKKKQTFHTVMLAQAKMRDEGLSDHGYLPIAGLSELNNAAAELLLGRESNAIVEERVASFQTISCTGALHLGSVFLSKFYRPTFPQCNVKLSNPSWGNQAKIFENVGFCSRSYPYVTGNSKALNVGGMIKHLENAVRGSIIVLHACGHNPTGVDPSRDQWQRIAHAIQTKGHLPFFDCTYQGLASGDLDEDAWAIRHFVDRGMEVFVAQSFAKNCGLYGQRVGCLHVVTSGPDAKETSRRIQSQLKLLQRCEISTPPAYGARIAALILNDQVILAEWRNELRAIHERLVALRTSLRSKLETRDASVPWQHITDQKGMYCHLGLNETQIVRLREEFHVYLTMGGRMSVAGLNTSNLDYVAMAVDRTVRNV